ncbi:uncharacterized protein LOC112087822 [Eutrema salsugineum]|uniref:uncharacterized protein LOC112087822 n=1 Tax=Eutrema salsugineum TaxID=72664 RepID=UPI000CED4218|nr:uncharacterized protein LOC112087822 [Eutrema salsugineum]
MDQVILITDNFKVFLDSLDLIQLLCVEITEKVAGNGKGMCCEEGRRKMKCNENDVGCNTNENNKGGNSGFNEDVFDDDEEFRFDCCDDSDGATSDDEDFSVYGRQIEDESEKQKLPLKRKGSSMPTKDVKELEPHVQLELNSLNLVVGQRYDSKGALETRLKILSVLKKFDFVVDKSTPSLLVVKCWVEECSWRVRATPVGDSASFYVRVYISEHTCSVMDRSSRSRKASPDILAVLYKDYVGGIEPTVLPSHVANLMSFRFGIQMKYWKAHRTLKIARDLVRGSPEKGYETLPAYLYMIKRDNPGTFTRLEVDGSERFKYLFIAYGASMSGFPFLRKVVVVDGTYLQGKYKGTLLIATAQDGNFQIFPIAFAIVDTENDNSWEWFFRQLNSVIPDDERLAIISDRHKAIGNAIGKRYRGGDAFGLVKKAANCFRLSDFETIFAQIGELNPVLHSYLLRADVKMWARVHFPGDRYNLTTTNIAESINKCYQSPGVYQL